jgi:two-component system NtrC family sensor kinase
VAAGAGTLAQTIGTEVDPLDDSGLVTRAIRSQTVQVETGTPERLVPVMADVVAHRAAVVPLRAHGLSVGAVAAVADATGEFDTEELRLLSTVATHASLALANAELFDLVRQGKDQWESTFDALADGVAMVDDAGRIRRANRSLAAVAGADIPAVVGQSLGETLFRDPGVVHDLLAAVRQTGNTRTVTERARDGIRVLRVTASPLRGDQAGWAVTLIEDITEQKALEAHLIQSEKLAAMGQLVSGVAHELNNPLTSILGLAEFLLETPNAPAHEHVGVIREQADRAARIVRDLLAFARRGPAVSEPVDLNAVARRAAGLMEYELRLRGIVMDWDLTRGIPRVAGNPHELEQVVLNLLANATHAVHELPADRRRIGMRTWATGGVAALAVSDSGPGIPADLKGRVFDPFVTSKGPGQGTGLGLSICYRIVETHGGMIHAEDAPGGGTTFVIELPVRSDLPERAAEGDRQRTLRPSGGMSTVPRGRRILLMDDDPAVQRTIAALFAHEGQQVQQARDAAHALELLRDGGYDLIIVDARAAVSAGERLADVIRTRHPDVRPRTILLTADVREETDRWLAGMGVPYFRKPFNVRELRTAAAEILKRV